MARRGSLSAEIVLGLDQAPPERGQPEPIDRDPGRERVLARDEPSGQVEPVGLHL